MGWLVAEMIRHQVLNYRIVFLRSRWDFTLAWLLHLALAYSLMSCTKPDANDRQFSGGNSDYVTKSQSESDPDEDINTSDGSNSDSLPESQSESGPDEDTNTSDGSNSDPLPESQSGSSADEKMGSETDMFWQNILKEPNMNSVEDFMSRLPDEYKINFVLLRESQSRHLASLQYPRIIIYGTDATNIFAISTNPDDPNFHQIEVAVFNQKNFWEFFIIDFRNQPLQAEQKSKE